MADEELDLDESMAATMAEISEREITDEDEPTPMPTIMTIDISLVETQSPSQLSNFSLSDYRAGILGKPL